MSNTKSKYLQIMDLEDAESDLREAENELKEIEKEKKALDYWGFSGAIPSELYGEINARKSKVRLLKKEVQNLEKGLKEYTKWYKRNRE